MNWLITYSSLLLHLFNLSPSPNPHPQTDTVFSITIHCFACLDFTCVGSYSIHFFCLPSLSVLFWDWPMLLCESVFNSFLLLSCCFVSKSSSFCDLVDGSQPGSSVRGILQARMLEWVAISCSRGSSWPRDSWVSCISRWILYPWATSCSATESRPTLCDPVDWACQASLSFTISPSLLRFMTTESVMLSNHLILCCPLLLLPSLFPSLRVFSNELALHIGWPEYWSFSFSVSASSEFSGSHQESPFLLSSAQYGLLWWLSWWWIPCHVGDLDSIPALGRSPGEGKGYAF